VTLKGYLLDTNIVGFYFGEHPNVMARVNSLPGDALVRVSAVTLGEIEFGNAITLSTDLDRRDEFQRWVNLYFPNQFVLSIGRNTRVYYGELKARLWRRYPPSSPKENHPERCIDRVTGSELGIDENDLWIAAQSIQHNLILVTNDQMMRIREVAPEIDVEDWTQPFPP
jgi:tRNA(fMet)-specific endonuclease VapC